MNLEAPTTTILPQSYNYIVAHERTYTVAKLDLYLAKLASISFLDKNNWWPSSPSEASHSWGAIVLRELDSSVGSGPGEGPQDWCREVYPYGLVVVCRHRRAQRPRWIHRCPANPPEIFFKHTTIYYSWKWDIFDWKDWKRWTFLREKIERERDISALFWTLSQQGFFVQNIFCDSTGIFHWEGLTCKHIRWERLHNIKCNWFHLYARMYTGFKFLFLSNKTWHTNPAMMLFIATVAPTVIPASSPTWRNYTRLLDYTN